MFPTLQLGPLALQTSGLIILAGIWLGLTFSERRAVRTGIGSDQLYNISFMVMISAIIGGRIGFLIQNLDAFTSDWGSIFSLSPQLFDGLAAVAVGSLAVIIYAQRHKISLATLLDAFTPALATLAAAIPLANLANGNGFGSPASLPWAIELWGTQRHPSQIYEFLAALILLTLLLLINRLPLQRLILHPGQLFAVWLFSLCLVNLFLYTLRGDSVLLLESFRQEQVLAWLGMLAGYLFWRFAARQPVNAYPTIQPAGETVQ